ncbi:hypothetical protein MRX96_054215 [Rhipicephalus microplus]
MRCTELGLVEWGDKMGNGVFFFCDAARERALKCLGDIRAVRSRFCVAILTCAAGENALAWDIGELGSGFADVACTEHKRLPDPDESALVTSPLFFNSWLAVKPVHRELPFGGTYRVGLASASLPSVYQQLWPGYLLKPHLALRDDSPCFDPAWLWPPRPPSREHGDSETALRTQRLLITRVRPFFNLALPLYRVQVLSPSLFVARLVGAPVIIREVYCSPATFDARPSRQRRELFSTAACRRFAPTASHSVTTSANPFRLQRATSAACGEWLQRRSRDAASDIAITLITVSEALAASVNSIMLADDPTFPLPPEVGAPRRSSEVESRATSKCLCDLSWNYKLALERTTATTEEKATRRGPHYLNRRLRRRQHTPALLSFFFLLVFPAPTSVERKEKFSPDSASAATCRA